MTKIFKIVCSLIIIVSLFSCNKEETKITSPQSLLQKTWSSRTTTLYKPSGELADVQIISAETHSFTFGTDGFCFWDTSSIKFHYRLLGDDSTLILEYFTPTGSINDTNYITTLNESILTFHGKEELFPPLLTRDTLR